MFVISLVRAKRPQIRYLHVPIVTLILMVTICPLSYYVESMPLESPTWDNSPSDTINSNSSPEDGLSPSQLSSAPSSSSNELQSKTISIQPSSLEDEPLELLPSSDEITLMNPQLYRLLMVRNGLINSQAPQASSSSSSSSSNGSSSRSRSKKALSLFAHWRPSYGQRPKIPAALSRREGRPFGKTLRWGR
ncbi:uncharacterized protein LOC141854652 [Brevipalpus obovatus]|uniref:uncharacterized protein LOC141854652 n=1 Tax=Brevipalpus obovatus TaxID=246614 RepID=UPI003D9F95A3